MFSLEIHFYSTESYWVRNQHFYQINLLTIIWQKEFRRKLRVPMQYALGVIFQCSIIQKTKLFPKWSSNCDRSGLQMFRKIYERSEISWKIYERSEISWKIYVRSEIAWKYTKGVKYREKKNRFHECGTPCSQAKFFRVAATNNPHNR